MIKIAVALYDHTVPTEPLAAVFGEQRQNIGRSDDNFLVLPDPNNEVSRAQASVWSDATGHWLLNLSQATPMRVNGREVAADNAIKIAPGDQIEVGRYVLHAVSPEQRAAGTPVSALALEPVMDEASLASAAANAADIAELKAAFLRGAGIDAAQISSDLTPELMELLGKLMATSLQGTIDLLALRSLVKAEVKADVTMVVVRNNNPLKFFPDSQTVLTQMLRKKMPGFMEPLESIDDAFHDLHAHQLGVVAGMHASMDHMLARIRPDALEASLGKPTLMDTLLRSRRTGALWAKYARRYARMVGSAKDLFRTLFGAAFLAAYEKEVERYHDGRSRG